MSSIIKVCPIESCSSLAYKIGLCNKHYIRKRRHGDPNTTLRPQRENHGLYRIPEYDAWVSMKQRCTNSKNPKYKDYGGRGIKVCKRWQESFTAFYEDMGKRPTPRHPLDRLDNNKDYSASNCAWVMRSQQLFNQRSRRAGLPRGIEVRNGKYQARICKDGQRYNLGTYDTVHKARRAYTNKARELYPGVIL